MKHPHLDTSGALAQEIGRIAAHDSLGGETFRLRIEGVNAIAASARPGQFVMLKLAEGSDPLLGRPLGIYRAEADGVTLLYRPVGKMTQRLTQLAVGTPLIVWGPLGNGWNADDWATRDRLVCVAGGIGQTPFLPLAAAIAARRQHGAHSPAMLLLFGGATRDRLVGIDDFEQLGVEVRLATDDGSVGHHGRVTDLLNDVVLGASVQTTKVLACGPHAMLKAVAATTAATGVACDVSLETPMACGLGLCFGCVVSYRDASGVWDYRRTCVDGPVFDASRLRWDAERPVTGQFVGFAHRHIAASMGR